MKITIAYGAQARAAAGTASECVEVEPGCALRGLLQQLAERHGQSFRDLLLDEAGQPRPSNLAVVGEEMVRWNDPRPLRDGSVVTILSPISGG
jgi:molybdopterin converting factor small subunit